MEERRTPPDRVFVYGTLRAEAGHPMAGLLAENARDLGPATLCGILLDIGPYPAALPSDEPADLVVGELYELDPETAEGTLARLDAYEGCPDGDHEPALYVRSLEAVRRPDGETVDAWVWFWNRSSEGLERIASGDWVRHRREG